MSSTKCKPLKDLEGWDLNDAVFTHTWVPMDAKFANKVGDYWVLQIKIKCSRCDHTGYFISSLGTFVDRPWLAENVLSDSHNKSQH